MHTNSHYPISMSSPRASVGDLPHPKSLSPSYKGRHPELDSGSSTPAVSLALEGEDARRAGEGENQTKQSSSHHPYGPYEKYFKRPLDIVCAVGVLVCFWWLFAIIAILVRIKLGSPVLFTQQRPGKNEKIFKLYKFRTMTDEKDKDGNLLPDGERLTKFGKFLRSTSLDELPEVFNILKGDMSLVGPRPQLVRDMVFMSAEHRKRHEVRPGLTGLAQINGRNDIDWQDKLDWDLKYIEYITFWGDINIIAQTFIKSFIKPEGITEQNAATATDYGDYLLQHGKVTKKQYQQKQQEAKRYLGVICTD